MNLNHYCRTDSFKNDNIENPTPDSVGVKAKFLNLLPQYRSWY